MNNYWNSGIAYERFMGRWSTLVAQKFLSWLDATPARTLVGRGLRHRLTDQAYS